MRVRFSPSSLTERIVIVSAFYIPVQVISKVDKVSLGMPIHSGNIYNGLMNINGYVALHMNYSIRLGPNDYDMYIDDMDLELLINGDVV